MLMKMGFQPESIHLEPYTIELRKGRAGLGAFEALKVKEEEDDRVHQELEVKRRKEYEEEQVKFQQLVERQELQKRIDGQLFAMLKLCYHLRELRIPEVSRSHCVPSAVVDDPPPLVADEQLHGILLAAGGMASVRNVLSNMSFEVQSVHHQQLSRYLREDFLYCFWCAHSYESQESMNEHCPGTTEEAHLNAPAPKALSPP